MKSKIIELMDKRKALNKQIVAQLAKEFPVGKSVCFTKGGHRISAEISQTAEFTEDVRVRSHTCKEYRINAWWLVEELRSRVAV
jgi:hypothetical protein